MKKCMVAILVFALAVSLVACGGGKSSDKEWDDALDDYSEAMDALDNFAETVDNIENEDSQEAEDEDVPEWEEFLREYENWVDDYITILKKYSSNPTDMSILSDYSRMASEMAEWTTKTEKVAEELENASPSEAMKYSAELARIAAKMAQAMY